MSIGITAASWDFGQTRRANQLLKMELIIPGEKRENYRPCEILVASPGRLLDFLRHNEKTKSGFLRNFFRRTTFVVVDEADSLMVKERDRDGEQHTFEILKSLRSDIQMLYRGFITESMVYHLFSFFHYLFMTRVCPIFFWLNHVQSHYFIVNCQFLMVPSGNLT